MEKGSNYSLGHYRTLKEFEDCKWMFKLECKEFIYLKRNMTIVAKGFKSESVEHINHCAFRPKIKWTEKCNSKVFIKVKDEPISVWCKTPISTFFKQCKEKDNNKFTI